MGRDERRDQTVAPDSAPMKRLEDVRLLTVGGTFVADVADARLDGAAIAQFVRSDCAHGELRSIDIDAARHMPGVLGVLTADEVTKVPEPQDAILTNEPVFVGQPILAVAAETEELAADALEKIKYQLTELPFTVDPLQSLYPGGPDARTNGNSVCHKSSRRLNTERMLWAISNPLCRRSVARSTGFCQGLREGANRSLFVRTIQARGWRASRPSP